VGDELEDKIVTLKKFDHSPYVIKGHDRKTQFFVGAFITKEGVDKEYRDLNSRGVQSEVVKR
jgi:hypothetical protein